MTLYELGIEYEKSAEPIRARLKELRGLLKTVATDDERWHIKRRIADLSPMLTECNKISTYLKRYYEHGYYINDGPFHRELQQFRTGDTKPCKIADCPLHIDKRTDRETTACYNRMFDKRENVSRLGGGRRSKQINDFSQLLPRIKET